MNCIFIISVSWRKVFQYCTSHQLLTKKKELLSSATMSLRAKYSCYIMLPKFHVRPIFFLVLWKLFTRLIIPPEVFVRPIRPMDYIYLYMRNFTQICLFKWNIRLSILCLDILAKKMNFDWMWFLHAIGSLKSWV